jgi:HD-GYP domain-containing protein (c-di-GMP phosphodiesterase class II)
MNKYKRTPKKKIIQLDIQKEIIHGMRVSNLAYRISKCLNLPEEICSQLAIAGIVHDIGKMRLARYIYGDEAETLTIEELKYIRFHPTLGAEFLTGQGYSEFIRESILHHHENFDGTGYPDNLQGESIPMGARILRVCDVFSALTSERPYRKAFDLETTIELMIEEVKNFDMRVFLAFQRVVHEEDIEQLMLLCLKDEDI